MSNFKFEKFKFDHFVCRRCKHYVYDDATIYYCAFFQEFIRYGDGKIANPVYENFDPMRCHLYLEHFISKDDD